MRLVRLTLAVACLLALGASSATAACRTWTERTIVSDQGLLENLAFDHRSAMLLSGYAQDAILRVNKHRAVKHLIEDVHAPGGLRVRGGVLYFNTGDSLASGLDDLTDGTIDRFRFRTARRTTWADGLTMPNGLVFLPNGDAIVSRDIGTGTGMTRISADDPAHPEFNWARLDDTNGIAVDPTGRWLYTVGTFVSESPVYRIRIKDPSRIEVVAELRGDGPLKGLDDMTIDRRGRLYIAANATGEVIRVHPDTGASCVIAADLQNPSAVKFGRGKGWSNRSLYVTGFDGTVRKLTPP
jgi:SMP-30/Gluconolactonase/LRE-like region